jgi:chromosome segregation ATPase
LVELAIVLVGILIAVTIGAALEYYRQVRKARIEYEKAKEAVDDLVLSFNRELKRESDRLEMIAYKVEANSSKADSGLKKISSIEKRIVPVENQLSAIPKDNTSLLTKLTDISAKMQSMEVSHEKLKSQVATLDEQMQKLSALPELTGEPVITIRRDKAMAALTDTEVAVLELLSTEGSKTAPEIKERVRLSREHTARLMKKLYEEGYLERETAKIPFKYSVKKEMERLLKKQEPTQT